METDREWDIALLEIQLENESLIQEFLNAKRRQRDRDGETEIPARGIRGENGRTAPPGGPPPYA